MATEGKFSSSRREDGGYSGEFDSREEAVFEEFSTEQEELRRDQWLKLGCWVGKIVSPSCPSLYIDANYILEHIACQDEYCVDWAENWPDSSKEQEAELTAEFQRVFLAWMEKHDLKPKFFNVDEIDYMTVEQALANLDSAPASDVADSDHLPGSPSATPIDSTLST